MIKLTGFVIIVVGAGLAFGGIWFWPAAVAGFVLGFAFLAHNHCRKKERETLAREVDWWLVDAARTNDQLNAQSRQFGLLSMRLMSALQDVLYKIPAEKRASNPLVNEVIEEFRALFLGTECVYRSRDQEDIFKRITGRG